jgi:hypothetical protein
MTTTGGGCVWAGEFQVVVTETRGSNIRGWKVLDSWFTCAITTCVGNNNCSAYSEVDVETAMQMRAPPQIAWFDHHVMLPCLRLDTPTNLCGRTHFTSPSPCLAVAKIDHLPLPLETSGVETRPQY